MEIHSVLLCTSANCLLYGGVRYWECPLREPPLYLLSLQLYPVPSALSKCIDSCFVEEILKLAMNRVHRIS